MIFMMVHVFTKYSIGKMRLRPNPKQQQEMNFNDCSRLGTNFNQKKAPAAYLKVNKNIEIGCVILVDNAW